MIIEIALLSIAALTFLGIGYKLKSWQVIGYSFLSVVALACLIFLKDNPEIKVSSQYLTLEQRVQTNETTLALIKTNQQRLEATQKQLQQTATALLKTILVVEDGVGRWGGDNKKETRKLIQKYTKEIQSLLPREYSAEVQKDLDSLYKQPPKEK